MINYPFNRIALQNGLIFYLFTIYTLSILFHFKTSHQKVNEFRITILSSNEIHSSLTIDRFSQSWRPESTHNRGTYIPLSSIDPKKEQEKTGVEHRVPPRLRASFHHRVRKTKNTGPSWWRADGGKEVAQAPLLHRRRVKASGWKCTLAWECQRAIVAKIRWCRPGTGSATRSRITYRIWDNGKRKPDWLVIHWRALDIRPRTGFHSVKGKGNIGNKSGGYLRPIFFHSCGWKNTAPRFIDPVFFRVWAHVSSFPIVYFRSKMVLVRKNVLFRWKSG